MSRRHDAKNQHADFPIIGKDVGPQIKIIGKSSSRNMLEASTGIEPVYTDLQSAA